ncbi:hypothetical protein, partial [Pseudomonas neuropathica]
LKSIASRLAPTFGNAFPCGSQPAGDCVTSVSRSKPALGTTRFQRWKNKTITTDPGGASKPRHGLGHPKSADFPEKHT